MYYGLEMGLVILWVWSGVDETGLFLYELRICCDLRVKEGFEYFIIIRELWYNVKIVERGNLVVYLIVLVY